MASPLRWFRKHEKTLLVVFGVGLMFVFTLSIGSGIDPIIDWLTGGGVRTSNDVPIVAEWKGGALTESDMVRLRQNRNLMLQYSMAVQQQASMRGRTPQAEMLPRMNNERSLVELAILQNEARKRGIVITDEAVLNYLIMLSGGSMQPAEFLQLWQNMTRGRGTERQLNALLRGELMAARLRGLVWSGARASSPIAFWDYFNRLEKRMDAEMMAIDVADFVGQVPQPTEDELNLFYAEYQDQHAEPGSPDPGFRQRRRLAFDYIRFDFENFLDAAKQAVSDEEIAKYYEENKSDFINTLPEDDLEASAGGEAEQGEVQAEIDAMGDAAEGDDGTEVDDIDQDNSDAGRTVAPDNGTTTDESLGLDANPPTVTETAAEPAIESDRMEDPAAELAPSPTPLPQEEAPDRDEPDTESSDPTAEEPTNENGIDSDEVASESAAADETQQDMLDDATKEEDNGTDSTEPSAESGAAEEAEQETTDSEAESKDEYKPLSEVEDDIRRAIAAPRAQEKMNSAMKTVQSRMNRYYKQHVMYEVRRESDDSVEPPEMPTLDDISEDPPLIISSIPLSDRFEIGQFDLGQAYEFEFLQERILRTPFAQIIYEEKTIPAYQPRTFPSVEVSPQFVYWLVGQEEANTPPLEDIRDQVVEAWQMRRAADVALEAAEQQAARARETGKPLSELLDIPHATTFQTGEISWLTGGNLPLDGSNTPRFSAIPGVDQPSEEMFHRLFRLRPGEMAVAMNRPRTRAFVMLASEPTTPTEERSEQYFANGINMPGLYPVMRTENLRLLSGWYDELTDSYGLTWQREPQGDVRLN